MGTEEAGPQESARSALDQAARLTRDGYVSLAKSSQSAEENIAARIEWEMRRRGWSQERLAKEMTDAGCPMHQSAISKIIKPGKGVKRRAITVNEAVAFARVFEVPLDELQLPLEVAQSQQAHLLIHEIDELSNQMSAVINREHLAWLRLGDLLNDQVIVDGYVHWLHNTKKMDYGEAWRVISAWIDRAANREIMLNDALTEALFTGSKYPPDETDHGVKINDHLPRAPLPALIEIRRFVSSIGSMDRKGIDNWLSWYTISLVRSGLGEVLAPLINRQMDGRVIEGDMITDAIGAVDGEIEKYARMTPLTEDDELDKLAAKIASRFLDGESETSLAEDTGESSQRIFQALKRVGLLF